MSVIRFPLNTDHLAIAASCTVTNSEMKNYGFFDCNTAGMSVALPTPCEDLSLVVTIWSENSGASQTLSGAFKSGASAVMEAYGTYTLFCVRIGANYKWALMGEVAVIPNLETDVDAYVDAHIAEPDFIASGTGFPHVTGGVLDTESKLVQDGDVDPAAAISQSKLNLAITDVEIDVDAAISQSKLDLAITDSDVDPAAAISQSKLHLAITNSEIDAAAGIAQSKLAQPTGTGFLHVTSGVMNAASKLVVNADVADNAAIAQSKLAQPTGTGFPHVTSEVQDAASKLVEDVDVHASAAIVESKLSLNFPTHSNANDPVAIATFVGTLGWSGGAPTVTEEVYRQQTIAKNVFWKADVKGTNGNDATTMTLTFPAGLVPSDVDMIVPVKCLVSVNSGAYVDKVATLDCEDGTAGNRKLTVSTGTLTDIQPFRIIISGRHEIA